MSKCIVSRRNVLKGTTAAIAVPATAQSATASPELLALRDKLLVARAERDRLDAILAAVVSKRPPIPDLIRRPEFPDHYLGACHWRRMGAPECAEAAAAYESAVEVADMENDFDKHNDAVEAACEVVSDIEGEMVDFEPRSIADLRLQVELALHQEQIDGGMNDGFAESIFGSFLRLIP